MLLKLIGALLLISGGGVLGIYYGLQGRLRQRELEQLKNALMLMYSETEFGHSPLWQMCQRAVDLCDSQIGDIFKTFYIELKEKTTENTEELWRSCLENNIKNTHLTKEDIIVISALGNSLGAGDINRQLTSITNVVNYIDTKNAQLDEKNKADLRLYKNTGILLGGLAVILLF